MKTIEQTIAWLNDEEEKLRKQKGTLTLIRDAYTDFGQFLMIKRLKKFIESE